MTLAVKMPNGNIRRCSVIRRPNFSDKTFDVPVDTFNLSVSDNVKAGTSAMLMKHKPTNLFYDVNGDKHWIKLERTADVRAKKTGTAQKHLTDFREMKTDEKEENCVIVIQVPLKFRLLILSIFLMLKLII